MVQTIDIHSNIHIHIDIHSNTSLNFHVKISIEKLI